MGSSSTKQHAKGDKHENHKNQETSPNVDIDVLKQMVAHIDKKNHRPSFKHECQVKECSNKPTISKKELNGDFYLCQLHRQQIAIELAKKCELKINNIDIETNEEKNENKNRNKNKTEELLVQDFVNKLYSLNDNELMKASKECGINEDTYFVEYFTKWMHRKLEISYLLSEKNENNSQLPKISRITPQYWELRMEHLLLTHKCRLLETIRQTCNPLFVLSIPVIVMIGSLTALSAAALMYYFRDSIMRFLGNHGMLVGNNATQLYQQIPENPDFQQNSNQMIRIEQDLNTCKFNEYEKMDELFQKAKELET